MLKTPSLPLKARRHPLLNIDGAGLCTLVDIHMQYIFVYQFRVPTFTRWFLAQTWIFLRTKTPLGFTIHTEHHQFYWDQRILEITFFFWSYRVNPGKDRGFLIGTVSLSTIPGIVQIQNHTKKYKFLGIVRFSKKS